MGSITPVAAILEGPSVGKGKARERSIQERGKSRGSLQNEEDWNFYQVIRKGPIEKGKGKFLSINPKEKGPKGGLQGVDSEAWMNKLVVAKRTSHPTESWRKRDGQ